MKPILSIIIGIFLMLFIKSAVAQQVQPDERGYIVAVGDTIGDLQLRMLDGTEKKLSDFHASVVVLNFFASWCAVCRQEIPHIEREIWQPLRGQGLVVLGIDYMEKPDTAKKFIEQMKTTYPVVLDENGDIFNRFARGGVTRNIVLDHNRSIIFLTRLFDPKEFEAMKEKIRTTLNIISGVDSTKKELIMEQIYLKDLTGSGKKVLLHYQGKHPIHLEGRINRKRWWGKLEIGVSLFEDDIISHEYDKETRTLRIGYRHYDGVRIAILPMTVFKVPSTIEQVVIFDVE